MSSLRSALVCGFVALATGACFAPLGPLVDFGRDCTDDLGCADFEPLAPLFYSKQCNEAFCDQGRCNTRPRDRPLAGVSGDCRRMVCRDGSPTSIVDDSDVPTGNECQDGTCNGGWSSLRSKADGTSCSIGVCRSGTCRPAVEPSIDASTEDASADASDDAPVDAGDDG